MSTLKFFCKLDEKVVEVDSRIEKFSNIISEIPDKCSLINLNTSSELLMHIVDFYSRHNFDPFEFSKENSDEDK